MTLAVSPEVFLIAGYAVFLILVAAGLEALGRYSHRRSELFHVAGFRYRRELDLWECPTGHQLSRSETDHQRRTARYRAPSHACNSCSLKPACTDSDQGRQIEYRSDSWLTSEIRRFHRGVSLALLLLAALIVGAQTLHHHQGHELAVLGVLLGSIAVIGSRLFGALREQ